MGVFVPHKGRSASEKGGSGASAAGRVNYYANILYAWGTVQKEIVMKRFSMVLVLMVFLVTSTTPAYAGSCLGGPYGGSFCTANYQCGATCLGGPYGGTLCTANYQCGATCTGGSFGGTHCTANYQCPGGYCSQHVCNAHYCQ